MYNYFAGGESGVPFRLQVDSFSPNSSTDAVPIHSAGCQVKVFKVSCWYVELILVISPWQHGQWQQWQYDDDNNKSHDHQPFLLVFYSDLFYWSVNVTDD